MAGWHGIYGRGEAAIDLFKENFRFTARCAGKHYSLDGLVTQVQWADDAADQWGVTWSTEGALPVNFGLTGSMQLTKPQLDQYNELLPPFLSSTEGGVARSGALGVVVVCSVGYGRSFKPLWAMRVSPGDSGAAEQIDLESGAWTLNLADDLYTIGLSVEDFKFTKGKTARRQGWRAHEIAHAVARRFRIPVKRLVRGTGWFQLDPTLTTGTSPLTVIELAYQEESKRTGKTYVVRWAAPDQKFPLGALEVVPLQRNKNLLRFRSQLVNAALSRSQSPDFATVIHALGTLRHGSTHRRVEHTQVSDKGVRRFGWVQKKIDFGHVSSELELQILAKRALALRLTPVRSAELTHPGVATIRRGDAIRIDLPEEGYAPVALNVYGRPEIPPKNRSKYSALQLLQAEKDDPSLFGLPDRTLLSATGSGVSTVTDVTQSSDALTMNQPTVVPVADQGIAFVTSVQHTLSAGSYSMDLQTGFVDVLDPRVIQEQVDAAMRQAKRKG